MPVCWESGAGDRGVIAGSQTSAGVSFRDIARTEGGWKTNGRPCRIIVRYLNEGPELDHAVNPCRGAKK